MDIYRELKMVDLKRQVLQEGGILEFQGNGKKEFVVGRVGIEKLGINGKLSQKERFKLGRIVI